MAGRIGRLVKRGLLIGVVAVMMCFLCACSDVSISRKNEDKTFSQLRVFGKDRVPEFDIDYGRHQGKLTLHVHYYTDGNRGKEPKVLSKDDELYKRFHRVFRGVRI